MKALYTNNWYCYCCTHIWIVLFFGPCGFHFIIPYLYGRKCYSPFSFCLHVTFLIFLVQTYFIKIIDNNLRAFLTSLFFIYYMLLFCHMYCFLKESFNPQPEWQKVLQRTQKKKSQLIV